MMRTKRVAVGVIVMGLLLGLMASCTSTPVDAGREEAPQGVDAVGALEFIGLGAELGDHQVAPDPETGKVWVVHSHSSTTGWSVLEYDPKTRETQRYELPFETEGYEAAFTTAIHAGSGRLWIAASDVFGYFDTQEREFVRIDLPEQQRVPATEDLVPGDDLDRWVWRTAMIESMALTTDDRIWLAREHSRGLLRYDPSAERFDIVETPDDVEVPGYLHALGSEIVIHERQREGWPKAEIRRGYHVLSGDAEEWERLDIPEGSSIVVSDGQRALTASWESGDGVGLLHEGDRVPQPLRSGAGGPAILDDVPGYHILALGLAGDVWYVKDGLDLARYDSIADEEVVYELPRKESPRGRGRHPTPFVEGTQTAPPEDLSPTYLSPDFLSVALDANGNLRFSYAMGFVSSGVACR